MGGFLEDVGLPSPGTLSTKLFEEAGILSESAAADRRDFLRLSSDAAGIFFTPETKTGKELSAQADVFGIGSKAGFEAEKQAEQQQVLLDTIAESLGPKETLTLKGGAPTSGTTTTLGEEDAKKKRRALRNLKQGTKQLQIPLETTTSQGISATTDTGLKV